MIYQAAMNGAQESNIGYSLVLTGEYLNNVCEKLGMGSTWNGTWYVWDSSVVSVRGAAEQGRQYGACRGLDIKGEHPVLLGAPVISSTLISLFKT